MSEARKSLTALALVVGGKLASIAAVFVGSMVMARFGGPAEYGVFATGMATILLLEGMIGSPLDMGAVRFSSLHHDERERTKRFEAMSFHMKLVVLIVAATGMAVWAKVSGHETNLGDLAMLTGVVACLLGARSVAAGLQIRGKFLAYSGLDLGQGSLRIALFLVLAWIGLCRGDWFFAAYGFVSLLVLATGLAALKQGYLLRSWPGHVDRRRMFKYCGMTAGVVCLGTLTGRGDILFLSHWHGPDQVANYGVASQLFLLMSQLSLYTSVVTQPRVLAWARAGSLRRVFAANLIVVGLLLSPMVVLYQNPGWLEGLIGMVFGEDYRPAASAFRVLMFAGAADLVLVPVLMVYVLQVYPAWTLAVELLATTFFVAVALFFMPSGTAAASGVAMAWLAVGLRGFKLLSYIVLFLRGGMPSTDRG